MLSHQSWRRQRLSESRVRALCHPPATTDGPQLLTLYPQGRVLLEYEFRALRWQHQTALKASAALQVGKERTSEGGSDWEGAR